MSETTDPTMRLKYKRPALSLEQFGKRMPGCSLAIRNVQRAEKTAKRAAGILRASLQGKEYRPVVGFEEFYVVTTTGQIISLRSGKPLVGCFSGGYLSVTLCSHDNRRAAGIHIIVAEAFLGPRPNPRDEVNHKDGVKTNNCLENLEWTTRSGNQLHAVSIGLKPCGENCHTSKLTERQAKEILSLKGTMSQEAIGKIYGIRQTQVGRIHRGTRWKSIHQKQA